MQKSYLPHRAFHAAYGLDLAELDVMLIEPDRSIRIVVEAMLKALGVKKLRAPRSLEDSFWSMLHMPPSVLILDQDCHPGDGLALVRRIRGVDTGQVAFIPALLTARTPTTTLTDMAIASGVNQLLIKPFSPSQLACKLDQLRADSRCFVLKGARYVIEPPIQAGKS